MSDFNVSTVNMLPDAQDDCRNHNCNGVVGGVCAFVPKTLAWWCCSPDSPACWRTRVSCGAYDTGGALSSQFQLCFQGDFYWCCSSEYDVCPPAERPGQCEVLGFVNPAADGPVWGPNATVAIVEPPVSGNTTAAVTPTTSPAPVVVVSRGVSPVAVGAGVGVAVGVALVGVAGYVVWRWSRRGKAIGPVEMSTEKARVEVITECPVEMPAAGEVMEMPAEAVSWKGVHELGAV